MRRGGAVLPERPGAASYIDFPVRRTALPPGDSPFHQLCEDSIMKKQLLLLALVSSCFVATGASAMTREEYSAAKQKVEADYKAAKASCDALKDNAKDVCMKEAKGTEDVAKAELEAQYQPSASHTRKVAEEKADMTYNVAKEKCDDAQGDAKKACVTQAKADHDKAKADIKAMKS